MGTNVHPAQILIVLAAVAVAAAATWRVLRRRTDARQRATLLAAAHAARRDPLTGLGSRFALHEAMATAISRRRGAAVILVNLDGSRPFVSRFGDRAFDQLLVLIAGRVQHLAAAAGGSSFRLRRDELAAIVDGPVTDATALAAQLLAAVAEPTEINLVEHPLTVTVSACADVTALTVNSADDIRLALIRSDTAMRSAKQAGRGRVAVFEPASVPRRSGAPPSAPTDGSAEGGVARGEDPDVDLPGPAPTDLSAGRRGRVRAHRMGRRSDPDRRAQRGRRPTGSRPDLRDRRRRRRRPGRRRPHFVRHHPLPDPDDPDADIASWLAALRSAQTVAWFTVLDDEVVIAR